MPFIVGVDVGGTFTDASAVRTTDGKVFTAKARSTPPDLLVGLTDALALLAAEARLSLRDLLADTEKFAHGTTQTSNVIFTWRGADTGLLTTAGFGDEILIMRARGRVAGVSLTERRHLSATSKPRQIVPRHRIVEVAERIDHRGRVLRALDLDEVERGVQQLVDEGIDSLAISFLWAPQNPDHEVAAEKFVTEHWPHLHVSTSHRLAPVLGEYERTSTTVVNAWVAPTVERYMQELQAALNNAGLRCPVLIVQASGGVVQAEDAVPVNTIESGPAAGMVAVRALAHSLGQKNVIATDVGGTTFKVGLLIDGEWTAARETIVNQYTLLIPMIDIASIGAGGGSIAWVDDTRLRIGPDSAGGDPGPACYGWGGTRATVTDADLVLGFINPDSFLGGRIALRRDLAAAAIQSQVADQLYDGDVTHAAAAIRTVVDSHMADLIRKATIEHGHDPRNFVLIAYGGAGPLHATDYARGLGIQSIVVPAAATAYSAYGAAASDISTSVQRSVTPDAVDNPDGLVALFEGIEDEAAAVLGRQQVTVHGTRFSRWADMRYAGQLHDVRVPLDSTSLDHAGILRAFEHRYTVLYGDAARLDGAGVRILRIGVDAVGVIAKPVVAAATASRSTWRDPDEARDVFWPALSRWTKTSVHDGSRLAAGDRLRGPAIVDHPGTTIVVPADWSAAVDSHGNFILQLEA